MQRFHEIFLNSSAKKLIPFCDDGLSTVWKNEKFSLTEKMFRQINSLVVYLCSKTFTFTEFLLKTHQRIPVIPTHTVKWNKFLCT